MRRLAPHDAAAAWARLLDLAAAEPDADRGRVAAAGFAGVLLATAKEPFPLDWAQDLAGAWLTVARRYIAAAQPEIRDPLGRFMAAGAESLTALIDVDRNARSARGRQCLPPGDR